jgi:hypothetical protein
VGGANRKQPHRSTFARGKPVTSRTTTALAFAATMLLAGFLLFQVQLVLGKFILPWFGGSAATWLVCMLFFQAALLVGYAYAYALTLPFPIRRQAQLQMAILVVSLALLPISPSDAWKPTNASDPTWRILIMLAACVGLPYIALATTTPLLSRWLAHIDPTLNPVRFFAASNIGSFLGLLSYPFLFERLLASADQTRWWSWAYVLYVALFAVCAWLTLAGAQREDRAQSKWRSGAGRQPFALWIGYSALGSALLLATTNAVTQFAAVVPFLWVVPLSCYLLTFVITFGYPNAYDRTVFGVLFLVSAGTTLALPVPESSFRLFTQIVLQAMTLFAGGMICHGEMVRLQPPPAALPRFYLAVAAGGALGGMGIVLGAPLLFSDFFEHPIVLVAIAAVTLLHLFTTTDGKMRWVVGAVAAIAGIYFLGGLAMRDEVKGNTVVERIRNFYGVVKIVRSYEDNELRLSLFQAGIDQGGQYQKHERKMDAICGFDWGSGLGMALAYHAKRRASGPQTPLRIGVIGMGAGMVATLGRDGDTLRYYELNPAVLELTSRHFTFIKDSKAKVDVLLGDARLVLERQLKAGDRQNFDVLVLDAFRGASPPMHLMTREAFSIYFGHLAENGILAVNFELDTFEVAPLHRGLARRFDTNVGWFETRQDNEACQAPISWALYTRDPDFFGAPVVRKAVSPWRDDGKSVLVWTDQDSNLMSIITWGRD